MEGGVVTEEGVNSESMIDGSSLIGVSSEGRLDDTANPLVGSMIVVSCAFLVKSFLFVFKNMEKNPDDFAGSGSGVGSLFSPEVRLIIVPINPLGCVSSLVSSLGLTGSSLRVGLNDRNIYAKYRYG